LRGRPRGRAGLRAPVRILAIETSCDETACAVVEDGKAVLSDVVASQVKAHGVYGGVVPEIASRMHIETITQVAEKAVRDAGIGYGDLDAVAVTNGPGLVGALLVGISAAKGMSLALGIPLIGVNHVVAHIYANQIDDPAFGPPFICLVASGGHSHVFRADAGGKVSVMGRTRDDAAGEVFDKVARALGLGYPGGPAIDAVAGDGSGAIALPRANLGDSFDYSFSGVKTAALNVIGSHAREGALGPATVRGVCSGLRMSIVDALAANLFRAASMTGIRNVAIAGGVAANRLLRETVAARAASESMAAYIPPPRLCTDNAAMVAAAAYHRYASGESDGLDLDAEPELSL